MRRFRRGDHGGDLFLPARHSFVRKRSSCAGRSGYRGGLWVRRDHLRLWRKPGSRIRFPVDVAGIDVQPQTAITDIATVLADVAAAFTQEGEYGSVFRDFALIGGNDGAYADGFHSRTLVHCENVHSIWFMGDGFRLCATSDIPNANDEYGNASGSTFVYCVTISNAGQGFTFRDETPTPA